MNIIKTMSDTTFAVTEEQGLIWQISLTQEEGFALLQYDSKIQIPVISLEIFYPKEPSK